MECFECPKACMCRDRYDVCPFEKQSEKNYKIMETVKDKFGVETGIGDEVLIAVNDNILTGKVKTIHKSTVSLDMVMLSTQIGTVTRHTNEIVNMEKIK